MKNRELLNLSIVVMLAIVFSLFSISINFLVKFHNFFSAYTTLPVAEFLINFVFLYLAGMIWLTYLRWRDAEGKRRELDDIVSSISPDVLIVVDAESTITMCNVSVRRMFGYETSEVINEKTDLLYFDRRSDTGHWHEIYGILEKEGFHIWAATGKKKNGELIPLEIIAGNLSGRGGAVLLLRDVSERRLAEEALQKERDVVSSAQQELAERKLIEERIKASLREKEVLLKEIHHRVKNNLQVISSMLNLQSRYIRDGDAIDMFKESQDRIRSMALIHEKLYTSEDLTKIDFPEYIRTLATYLFHSYRVTSGSISLRIDVDNVLLNIDTAIPCGLIINELVSNSLKHAFPPGGKGEIRIALRSDQNGALTLMIGDDGVGFPEGLDFRSTKSLGLQLVNTLVEQLDGTLDLDRSHGTEFRISWNPQSG